MEEQKKGEGHISQAAKRLIAIAAALVLVVGSVLVIGGLRPDRRSAEKESPYDAGMPAPIYAQTGLSRDMQAAAPMAVEDAYANTEEDAGDPAAAQQKIIRTVRLNMNTRAFDEDLAKLSEALKEQGGYVEYSDISSDRGSRRYASLTLRVPKENLDAYLKQISGVARTVSISESQEDVSENYSDTKTRLATQTTKMERLQDLLSKALLVDDVLRIESEIANTQYQIDRLTGTLRGLDSRVDYSTVNLQLTEEVVTEAPGEPGLGQRIKLALSDAWDISLNLFEEVLIALVVLLPYVLIVLVLVFVIKAIVRRKKK